MPFVVGENIGPYRILEQLGRGGMATVFKAYHAALDRYVAIKALHPAFMEDPNFHARFQREARVVAKLEHPNIVPIYDFAEHEGRPYLVMKYIEGETLKARLVEGTLPQSEQTRIVEAVGAGLYYAHQKGILHRDVKPSNVLLGNDGGVYLADFGLARIAQAGESTLSSDMMLGTPQYISPEQAMGLGELDERTDIYSFGVMLYELAVGKVPFSADTPFSIIHDHIYTPLPLPRTVNPDVSEPVERVLLKALAKERDDRYPDAKALSDAFVQAVAASPEPESKISISQIPLPVVSATVPADAFAAIVPPIQETSQPVAATEIFHESRGVPAVEAKPPQKEKRRFRWWFVVLGIIGLIAVCLCVFLGLSAIRNWSDDGQSNPPGVEQLPEEPLPVPFNQPEEPLDFQEAPLLDEAQSWVDDAVDDPYAWLNLAEAYWASSEVDEAKKALNQALELSDDDPDFYFETAAYLAENSLWVEAAHVYLVGIQRFYPEKIPLEVVDEFREAVYWAAEAPEAERNIPIPEIAKVDPPMERVAKARYLFHLGKEDEAFSIVEQILVDKKPGMPEALYLKSEFLYAWGDTQTALNIFYELQNRDDTPDWIREIVDQLLEDAFSMQQHAQEQIDGDPENPYVYLPLYEWYLAFGLYGEASDLIQQALGLTRADIEFILAASEVAARNGAWLENAQLLYHAGQLNPEMVKPEFSERIVQALYYGAADPRALEVLNEIEPYLPDGVRGEARGAYRDALIARYKLYNEDPTQARAMIEEVVNRVPILPLPKLIQAETYLFVGDILQGEAILLDLQNNRTVPAWVKDEVQFMLDEIKINP